MNDYRRILKKLLPALFFIFIPSVLPAQSWTTKSNLTGPARDAGICFALNGNIYFGGGTGQVDFWEYNPATDTWTSKGLLPNTLTQRIASFSFAINGKGYIGGGYDTTVKKDLWEYDPATNLWAQKAAYPGSGGEGAFSFILNNKAYVGGGCDSAFNIWGDMSEYDPVTNTWTPKADYPDTAVIYPFSFTDSSIGYLSCGLISTEINKTYAYNPVTNSWSQKADFPASPRQAGTSFVLNGKAYCGLGTSDNFANYYQDFFIYNPSANTWSSLGNMPGSARAWPSSAVVNNIAYLGAGWSGVGSSTFYKDWWEFYGSNVAVGTVNQANKFISAWPNPVADILHLELPPDLSAARIFYDIYGVNDALITKGKLLTGRVIDMYALNPGVYLIKIYTADQAYEATATIIRQ